MSDHVWWYEWYGQQAGPVSPSVLLGEIRSGRVDGEARVWRAGMAGWEPLRAVPELAAALPQAPEPATPRHGFPLSGGADHPEAAAATPGEPAHPRSDRGLEARTTPAPVPLQPVSIALLVALGFLTVGIYPLVQFYRAGEGYGGLAGRPSRFSFYFWLYIGLALASVALQSVSGPFGVLVAVASVAFGILTLFEVLALRAAALRGRGVALPLTSDATHKGLYIVGLFTGWLGIGVVLFVVQAILFFRDHNTIVAALGGAAPAGGAAAAS